MKERISQLANGIIKYEKPKLRIPEGKIEESVDSGLVARGEFYIISENNIPVKGLLYSTNYRVTMVNPSFGGIKNRIEYEVKGQHLKHKDEIRGCFHLITNAGEIEIPYCFYVVPGTSGKALGELLTPQDFSELAQENMDIALRLFEYSEFIKAPFMQDLTIRAIYDSVRGKGNRELALEEFLIGIAVKDPIEIAVEKREWLFPYSPESVNALIEVRKNTWGYVKIQIAADADFIELEKETLSGEDFHGNTYGLSFQVNPQKLHLGRNYGRIKIQTIVETIEILITAVGPAAENTKSHLLRDYKYSFYQYINHRLDYESGRYQEELLLVKMQSLLEHLFQLQKSNLTALLLAENLILRGKADQACLLLDEYREPILSARQEELELYCFYQYLQSQIPNRDMQKDSLVRLLHKFDEEEAERFYPFLLLLKLDTKLLENNSHLLSRLKAQYQSGCNSPFLYLYTCTCLNKEPELLQKLHPFELKSLAFGSKKDLIGEALALRIAKLSALEKNCQKIYLKLLQDLYEKYPHKEILEGICGILIKGNCKSSIYFPWFSKGVKEEIHLTKFFEYYLYTCPGDFKEVFPAQILLYFTYPHSLTDELKELLYYNILTHLEKDSPIYESYERQMEDFAITSLFAGRINDKMALIYQHMIYKDLIDEKIARVFPEILRSYRIECKASFIRSVVVSYEELKKKVTVPLENGVAYVPMYVDDCILLFQDAYGNRYIEVDYQRSRLMVQPELEKRCFEIYPDHPIIQTRICKEIIKFETLDANQAGIVERVLNEKILHQLYEKKLTSLLISYYSQTEEIQEHNFLAYIDKSSLSPADRVIAVEAFIQQGQISTAYDMIEIYGFEGIKSSRLMKFCTKVILERLFQKDDLLLAISYHVFQQGIFDKVILDYLCEYYNGTVQEMYEILLRGAEASVETYNMEERLLGQILYTGQLKYLDQVFHLYIDKKKVKGSLVRAYLTVKCYEYFVMEKEGDPEVFEYLETNFVKTAEFQKTPVIWQLALTKYYAYSLKLTEVQENLCQIIIPKLLEQGYLFKYMQQFYSFSWLPNDVKNKIIIEYRKRTDHKVKIRMKILPEEEHYHSEDMLCVFDSIYVKQMTLFDSESLDYEIYVETADGEQILKSTLLKSSSKRENNEHTPDLLTAYNRFSLLNEIALCMDVGDEILLKEKMQEYVIKDEMITKLFDV